MDDYIAKPVQADEMFRAIARHVPCAGVTAAPDESAGLESGQGFALE